MNFNSILEELDKLYDEEKAEKAKQAEDEVKEEPIEEGCAKKEDTVEESLGAALAVGAGALAGTAIGNLISESADDEEEIEFAEEPVATLEGKDVTAEETRQLILECSKCGAVVIKDEAEVAIDEESDLVNVKEECQYCEEAEGYKIIGVVAPYEVAEEAIEEEEAPAEEEDFAEEGLEKDGELEELLDLAPTVNLSLDGGEGNAVDVL